MKLTLSDVSSGFAEKHEAFPKRSINSGQYLVKMGITLNQSGEKRLHTADAR